MFLYLTISTFLIFLVRSANCTKFCYDDLGCFNDSYPFSELPQSPQKIGCKFTLYNRNLENYSEELSVNSINSSFDSTLPTKVIVHGFLQDQYKRWIIDIKDALIKVHDVNVIVIDWSKGNGFPYSQAKANTRLAGAELARLILCLIKNKGVNASSFHLIGHSLGAHLSGYAGERIPGLGRITGLDPAGPYFDNTDPIVRLDQTDAQFVDVIHTDISSSSDQGMGYTMPCGHVDFYVNGGYNQPGCLAQAEKYLRAFVNLATMSYDEAKNIAICSHRSAHSFFIDSIANLNCQYKAYPCQSKLEFNKGNCLKCGRNGCNQMGYWASPNKDLGTLYLNTKSVLNKNGTFCKQLYAVHLVSNEEFNSNLTQAKGNFSIYFEASDEKSALQLLDNSETVFNPNSNETRLVSLDFPFNKKIKSLYLSYKKTSNIFISWRYADKWSFKHVELFDANRQVLSRFCPVNKFVSSGKAERFKKCGSRGSTNNTLANPNKTHYRKDDFLLNNQSTLNIP